MPPNTSNEHAPVPAFAGQPQAHPFREISSSASHVELHAVVTDEIVVTKRAVGYTLLALGTGMAQEKTLQHLRAEAIERAPELAEDDAAFTNIMSAARRTSGHRAPDIITHRASPQASTFYYEDSPRPQDVSENFAHWGNGTHIRFDEQTGYLVVSHAGRRTGARVQGGLQKLLWNHLLHEAGSWIDLKTLVQLQSPDDASSRTKMRTALREHFPAFIESALDLNPDDLLGVKETPQSERGWPLKQYKILADSVEFAGAEYKTEIVQSPRTIPNNDIAVIALSLMFKQHLLEPLTELIPSIPRFDDLAFLSSSERLSGPAVAVLETKAQVAKSLQKVMDLIDDPEYKSPFEMTQFDHVYAHDLFKFLVGFDRVDFRTGKQPVRGLQVLSKILTRK